jgi:hypothetical protein
MVEGLTVGGSTPGRIRSGFHRMAHAKRRAIHTLAPTCERCGCRIIGYGVEADGRMFCCAKQAGIQQVADRA